MMKPSASCACHAAVSFCFKAGGAPGDGRGRAVIKCFIMETFCREYSRQFLGFWGGFWREVGGN